MRHERQGLAALLLVVAVWGTTFPAMKLLSAHLDALQIIWARFAIALLVLAPAWRGLRADERRWGLLLGGLLFLAFWLQIEGLARTSSNRNAFVTGLNVLVVPLLAMALMCWIFSAGQPQRLPIAVWNEDGASPLSRQLVRMLEA
ncbi:MAG TPA: hypothetical protein DIC45_01595, partial [Comamonadaceae bacterium]|nr:hypothetical protein [Comamonadaceae bacterium]